MENNTYMDPSFALAYSYYQIYCQADTATETGTQQSGSSSSSGDADISPSSEEPSPALWTTDSWTPAEEKAAQDVLALHADKCQISPALKRQLPSDTQAWDRFYQQHQTNFFKDRHYLATAFPNEFTSPEPVKRTLVEIGCGVGNTLLPLIEDTERPEKLQNRKIEWTVYGVDLSAVAIALLKQDARFQRAAGRAWAGVADLVRDGLPTVCHGQADVATLLFCLSAVAPDHHVAAARHAAQALRPNGVLVLRDYGRYDQAELQLAVQRGKRLAPGYYVKHDQTKCYYFSTQDLRRLFVEQLGLEELENGYIQRQYVNRGDGTRRRRVWVQARFRLQSEQEGLTNGE